MDFKNNTTSSELKTALKFLAPNFIGFLIFVSVPIFFSFVLSFFECDLLQTKQILTWKFVGLKNFSNLLGFHIENNLLIANDPEFWSSLGNTLILMLKVPFSIMFALILAVILNKRIKGAMIFRTIYFLPTICTGTALYMLLRWIFNSDFGLLNLAINKITFGLFNGPEWLSSPAWAKPAFILMNIWIGMGGINLIIYLAAMQSIPQELYEAASLDGANYWQKFINITWPMLGPATFFLVIINLIDGFQGFFQQAHIITQGGPAGSTTTISYYIYNQAYVWNHMGYAAAIALMLFIIVITITSISWKYGGKIVHYR